MTRINLRAAATHAASVVLMASLLAPSAAGAQGQIFGRVTGTLEEVFDDNLFAAPVTLPRQSDVITRFGPAVEVGYRSLPLALLARYGFDAERYRTLHDLDDTFARQEGTAGLNYRSRRLALNLEGSYLETQTPSELNIESLLVVGRAQAERIAARSGLSYEMSALTSVNMGYEFTSDGLAGGIDSTTRLFRAGIGRKLGSLHAIRGDYEYRDIDFSDGTGEESYVVTGGWTHGFTRSISFQLDAGVRNTTGDIDPEISALLRRRLRRGDISVGYLRTQETTIGESGSVDVRRLTATVTYTPTRSFEITASPSRALSIAADWHAVVHGLDMESRLRVTRRWSVSALGRIGEQDRTFDGRDETVPYRSISVRTLVTLGTLERESREDGTQ